MRSAATSSASSQEVSASNPGNAEEIRKLKSELEAVRKTYHKMEESRDAIKDEMDRRALRGDYNPDETRVLHFRYGRYFQ